MVMRTRFVKSSSNSMSSNDEHRKTAIPSRHNPKTTAVQSSGHRTVLLHEAIEQLVIGKRDVVVDATLGGGGHAKAIAELLGKEACLSVLTSTKRQSNGPKLH